MTAVRSEEVTFYSDGCTIAGTFTEAAGPVAAALLITGSGKLDRNSDARLPAGRKLSAGVTKAVAGALAEAGVSTLRYDKRGVGASGGDYLRAGMDDLRADARAALGWLAAKAGGLPLLAVGHSEGAWYAAELAADDAVAGAVLLAPGARPAEEILSWQTEMIAARIPATARMILKVTRTDIIRSQRKRVARIKASTTDVFRIQGFRVSACWCRDFLAYDPRPALARIKVPVLAITGGQDVQVPPEDVAAIGRLVQGSFEGHVASDLSHLFRHDPASAGPQAYRRSVREPVDAEVLELITTWITTHWAGSPGRSTAAVSGLAEGTLMESFQLDGGHVHVHFAAPQVPPGMRYDPDTLLVVPAAEYYAAGRARVLASVALGVLLFAGTLGIGYLAWSVATWKRGQTPSQRLLGLRCWDPEARRVPGRGQMAQRQFFGLVGIGWSLLMLLSLVFFVFSVSSGRSQTSLGDFILGTTILRDPDGVLLS